MKTFDISQINLEILSQSFDLFFELNEIEFIILSSGSELITKLIRITLIKISTIKLNVKCDEFKMNLQTESSIPSNRNLQ